VVDITIFSFEFAWYISYLFSVAYLAYTLNISGKR